MIQSNTCTSCKHFGGKWAIQKHYAKCLHSDVVKIDGYDGKLLAPYTFKVRGSQTGGFTSAQNEHCAKWEKR